MGSGTNGNDSDCGVLLQRRCELLGRIGSGGMAAVHVARLDGPMGFTRIVAVKTLHQPFAQDPRFVSMLLDEARLASHVRHPYVIGVIDLAADRGELLLVLEYVHGCSLRELLDVHRGPVPVGIAVSIVRDVLAGLEAAHEARGPGGSLLGIVHRDVSPHNVLVGVEGIARIGDFGIAKAAWRAQTTRDGQMKGKLAYMAPEQILDQTVDRRTDVFGASVILWELLTGQRLFDLEEPGRHLERAARFTAVSPCELDPEVPSDLGEVVLRGLSTDPEERHASAQEMVAALESAAAAAPRRAVAAWVNGCGGDKLAERTALLHANHERPSSSRTTPFAAPAGFRSSPDDDTAQLDALAARSTDPSAAPVENRPLGLRWIGLAALILAATGSVGFLVHASGDPGPPPNAAPSPSAETTIEVLAPAAVAAPAPTPVAPPSASAPAPTLEAATSGPAAPKSTRALRARSMPGTSAPVSATHTPRPSCNPPFAIDEAGVKTYKPECI